MLHKECACAWKDTMNNDILYRRTSLPVNPYAGGACVLACRSEWKKDADDNVAGRGTVGCRFRLILGVPS